MTRFGKTCLSVQIIFFLRMKFQENRKINNSRTTHALFRVDGVSIDYLKMDYKRRPSLSSSPEVQGLLNALKHLAMVKH